jgi:hypothetical protein
VKKRVFIEISSQNDGAGRIRLVIEPNRARRVRMRTPHPKRFGLRTLSTATESVNPTIAAHWKIMDYLAGAEKSGSFESLTNRGPRA